MTEQELKELAQVYIYHKAELDLLKKKVDKINSEIKSAMEDAKLDAIETDTGTVKYGITRKETLNEDMLLVKLKKLVPNTECIKTKEYIDTDILESEIYHGLLSKEALQEMENCTSVKLTPVLTISKAKKGK